MSTTTPTPADLMTRRPSGAPGGTGGQFVERRNSAPGTPLGHDSRTPPAHRDDVLGVPSLADGIFDETRERAAELDAAYRDLWKRVNAKHRTSVYGDARRLASMSTDPAELAIMSHLAYGEIARDVAANPHTPAEVLHQMAVGDADHRDAVVRELALQHPSCDEATIRIAWAHRHTLDFAGHGARVIPDAPNTPADIRAEAATERR